MIFTKLKNSASLFPAMILFSIIIFISGCGAKQTAQQAAKVEVKAMQVITKNAPITEEFVGEVIAKDEVELKAKVSGQIIAKMVEDGQDDSLILDWEAKEAAERKARQRESAWNRGEF